MSAKYNLIGIDYNSTRNADKYLTQQLIKHLNPNIRGVFLDIGCGTGNYTNALSKHGFSFIGIDPSELMLEKAKLLNNSIDWRIGSAEHTGLNNASIEGIIGSLTIHHWTDLNKAFIELKRILKPKGRIVFFTSTPKQMEGYWLNHYFPKMLQDAIKQMPTLNFIRKATELSGLQLKETHNYFVSPNLEDKFLYCGKHNPKLYFDEGIRHGISSFSDLANKNEISQGLAKLKQDISSGKIHTIIKSYENDLGDYLYIIIEKNEQLLI